MFISIKNKHTHLVCPSSVLGACVWVSHTHAKCAITHAFRFVAFVLFILSNNCFPFYRTVAPVSFSRRQLHRHAVEMHFAKSIFISYTHKHWNAQTLSCTQTKFCVFCFIRFSASSSNLIFVRSGVCVYLWLFVLHTKNFISYIFISCTTCFAFETSSDFPSQFSFTLLLVAATIQIHRK